MGLRKGSWPLVKREGSAWLWAVPGSGGTRYQEEPELERIMIGECKHHGGTLFIQSERGPEDRRTYACVCKLCGLFIVSINGERMTFALVSGEQVEAAGAYARYLRESER